MIELIVLKEVIDTLPISCDIVEINNDNEIKYQSGRVLPLDKPRILAIGAKVISVRHEFDEKKQELYVSISHIPPTGGFSWFERVIIGYPTLFQLQNTIKMKKIISRNE